MIESLPTGAAAPDSHRTPPLVLASGSPRRRDLLAGFGVDFDVVVSDAPEDLDPALPPDVQAVALAERKARAVGERLGRGLILGADTIVVLDGEILGKPADDDDARKMLRRLSGRSHQVITGMALFDAATGTVHTGAVTSTVMMKPASDEEIAAYVATGEPRDKAGAYAIQGIGRMLIESYTGSFSNIVGLPRCLTEELLSSVKTSPRTSS